MAGVLCPAQRPGRSGNDEGPAHAPRPRGSRGCRVSGPDRDGRRAIAAGAADDRPHLSPARRARREQGAALDALGVPQGGRVAMVSHNAARLLPRSSASAATVGSSCRSTSGLSRDEVAYIVEHSGADVLLLDPEVDDVLGDIPCKHRFVMGAESDDAMFLRRRRARARGRRTKTPPRRSTTRAAPRRGRRVCEHDPPQRSG